jgi:hypothetical protein
MAINSSIVYLCDDITGNTFNVARGVFIAIYRTIIVFNLEKFNSIDECDGSLRSKTVRRNKFV